MHNASTTTLTCRVCHGSQLLPFVHLGNTPLADRFLSYPAEPEQAFPLDVRVCADCHLVQLVTSVDRGLLYGNDYAFYTGASPSSVAHFTTYADEMQARFPEQATFTVEIAGNDGEFLKHFQAAGKRVLKVLSH
jgi:Putative zinc binding domain